MLTTFTDALYDRLSAAMPASGDFNRARLSQGGLPVPIVHFLEHTLERRIEVEARPLTDIASAWVDHDLPELRLGREAYVRLLARHARFPAAEWPRALRQACELVPAHLVRPVPTLIHFVFGEEQTELPAADVARRVEYFVAYSYLRTAVDAYLERQGGSEVKRRQLTDVLSHVERAMTADWSADEWSATLAPLGRLSASAGFRGIPIALLEAFFDAKQAPDQAARARAWARKNDRSELDGDALTEALTAVYPNGPDPSSAADLQTEAAPESGSPIRSSAKPPAASPVEKVPLPLWKQFAAEAGEPGPAAAPTDEPLWKRFRSSLGPGTEPTALSAVEREVLGAAALRRDDFVRELFGGSEVAYGRLLGAIRATKSWPEASGLLAEEVFRRHKIDIYSPTAVEFTNAVEARFRSAR